jgi:predicted nucleotidyltransferase
MKPSAALSTHRDAVRRIVEAHRARNPRVFGSAARGEDRDDSDLDLLIDLLGVSVDIVTESSLRPRTRQRILAHAQSV